MSGTDKQFPVDFSRIAPDPGVKILADNGVDPGYILISDIADTSTPALTALQGVQINNLQINDVLVWNGSQFVNQPAADGEILDGGNW